MTKANITEGPIQELAQKPPKRVRAAFESSAQPHIRSSMSRLQLQLKKTRESMRTSMKQSFYTELPLDQEGSLGHWGSVLAIMSTIVGGGMVSIPWAFYHCGFILSVCVCLITFLQAVLSSSLLLKSRQICPERP